MRKDTYPTIIDPSDPIGQARRDHAAEQARDAYIAERERLKRESQKTAELRKKLLGKLQAIGPVDETGAKMVVVHEVRVPVFG